MKFLIGLMLALFTQTIMAQDNCQAITNDNLCVQLEWTQGPFLGAYAQNIVKFKDLNVSDDDGSIYRSPNEAVRFFGWMIMASHEHGTRPVQTTQLEEGVYQNDKIFYMGGMLGTWQFKLTIGNQTFVLHALDV
jgi:hypothetical protein